MTAPLRFVFCSTDGWRAFNGINAWLLRLLPALRARGHDARALFYAWSRPEDCMAAPQFAAAGVPVEIVFPPRTTEAGVRLAVASARRHRPDLFVAGSVVPALYAAGWLRAAGIATVAVLHNDDAEYRAKLRAFAAGPPFFRPSGVVAMSHGLADLARELAPATAVRRLPCSVPLAPARAQPPRLARLRLIYHGRMAQEQKRIHETLTAVLRAAERHPGVEADFCGDGPEREAIAGRLADGDAGGRVRLRPALPAEKVMSVLPEYHAAVLLSDHEGLGLSMLEAMACGVVPVCRRTQSGLPDFIVDGVNGLFVADRDSGFDRAIDRLVFEPELWPRLSAAAVTKVQSDYSPTAGADAWEHYAHELRAGAGPTGQPRLPWRLRLPPPDPDLRGEDRRFPGFSRAVWRRLRFGSRQ